MGLVAKEYHIDGLITITEMVAGQSVTLFSGDMDSHAHFLLAGMHRLYGSLVGERMRCVCLFSDWQS